MSTEYPSPTSCDTPHAGAAESDDIVQVASARAPFEAIGAELPTDPESVEFAQALQALKPLFGSRTEYNFMVCDQLALRGLPPNGLNVRKAGSWGAPVAVGVDVKAWYAGLSARLSSEHAKIPEASRRAANSLMEQLWTLALDGVGAPLADKLAQVQASLDSERDSHLADTVAMQDEHKAHMGAARLAVEEAERALNAMHADLSQVRADLAEIRGHRLSLAKEVSVLNASIAEAALSNEREKREMAQAHQAALHTMRVEEKLAAQAHAQAESALRQQLQAERTRLDEASRSHALAVDAFRQDLRAAVQRGDQAIASVAQEKSVASDLREQLAAKEIECSRLARQASELNESLEQCGQQLRLESGRRNLLEHELASARDALNKSTAK